MGTAGGKQREAVVLEEMGVRGHSKDPKDHCKCFVFYLSEIIRATDSFLKQRSDVV